MTNPGSDYSGNPTSASTLHGGALIPAPQGGPLMPAGPGSAYAPEILHGGFNQTWMMNCLRRRWLSALLLGSLVGLGVAALLLWLFPVSASTLAYVEVKTRDDSKVFDAAKKVHISAPEMEKQQNSQLALIKSQYVLQNALNRADIINLQAVRDQGSPDDAVLWLYEDLRASFSFDGNLMEVKYEGEEDPKEMEQIVQAVVDTYIQEAVFKERANQRKARETMERTLVQRREFIKDKMDEYEQLANVRGGQHSATYEVESLKLQREITELSKELTKVKSDIVDVDVFQQVAISTADSPLALEAQVQNTIAGDPIIKQYEEQMILLQQQYLERQSRSKNPNSRDLAQLRGQISQIQATMESYTKNKKQELYAQLKRIPKEGLTAVLTEWKIRRASLDATVQDLNEQLDVKNKRLLELGTRDPDLDMKKEFIESQQQVEADLAMAIEGWKIDEDSVGDRITVASRATSKPRINTIERFTIAGVGSLAALTLTAYGVALLEFRRRRLNGAADIDDGLGIRVLGVLPATTPRKTLAPGPTAAQTAEAIDSARAAIIHGAGNRTQQVLLVVSPDTMEGATTVAVSLARSFARAGRRTLLVDGDLRSPSVHSLFGLPLDQGLSDVLRAKMDVADAIRPTSENGLYVMTAGVCDREAVHALATDQPQPIFDQLRAQFDFIVIDGAPVLNVADSLALGQFVDGAILTVLRDHSEMRHVNKAAETLHSLGIRLIGSIVNGVPFKSDIRVKRLHAASPQQRKIAGTTAPKEKKRGKGEKAQSAASRPATQRPAADPPAATQLEMPGAPPSDLEDPFDGEDDLEFKL